MKEDLGAWGNFGAALGRGTVRGLEAIAESREKQQETAQRKESNVNALRSVGFSEEEASQLSTLPQQDIGRLLLGKQKEEGIRARYAGSAATLSQTGGGEGASQEELQKILTTMPPNEQLQYLKLLEDRKNKAGDVAFRERSLDEKVKGADKSRAQQKELAELSRAQSGEASSERIRVAEEKEQRKAMVGKLEKAKSDSDSATAMEGDLRELIRLTYSPDLRSGPGMGMLDKFGLGGFFRNPDSEVAESLAASINVRTFKDLGPGGKVLAATVKEVLKSNPSLMTRPETIRTIAHSELLKVELAKALGRAVKRVRAENKGALPLDSWDRVEELVAKEEAKIYKQAAQLGDSFKASMDAKANTFEAEGLKEGDPAVNPFTGQPLEDGTILKNEATGKDTFVARGVKWVRI